MFALLRLQFKSFIGNPASMFALIMPVIFVSVLATTMAGSEQAYTSIIANALIINLMSTLMFTFGTNLMEMKNSSLMKRIGSTSITKTGVIASFFIFNAAIGLLSVL
jgi:hypothetical protein